MNFEWIKDLKKDEVPVLVVVIMPRGRFHIQDLIFFTFLRISRCTWRTCLDLEQSSRDLWPPYGYPQRSAWVSCPCRSSWHTVDTGTHTTCGKVSCYDAIIEYSMFDLHGLNVIIRTDGFRVESYSGSTKKSTFDCICKHFISSLRIWENHPICKVFTQDQWLIELLSAVFLPCCHSTRTLESIINLQ